MTCYLYPRSRVNRFKCMFRITERSPELIPKWMPLKAGVLFLCSVSIIRGLSSDQRIPNRRINWCVRFGNCLNEFFNLFVVIQVLFVYLCQKCRIPETDSTRWAGLNTTKLFNVKHRSPLTAPAFTLHSSCTTFRSIVTHCLCYLHETSYRTKLKNSVSYKLISAKFLP